MDNPETQATWDTRQIEDKEKKQQQKTQTTKMIISKCLTKFVTYDCIEFTLSRTAVNFLHLSGGWHWHYNYNPAVYPKEYYM
jgi:hypothetical protein